MFKTTLLASLASFAVLAFSAPAMHKRLASGTPQMGDVTFYKTGLGSCGVRSADSDSIVALSIALFDSFAPGSNNPNTNPVCGRKIKITPPSGDGTTGQGVTVTVVDKCQACQFSDLDLSPSAFQQLADSTVGRLHNVTWELLP